jgi:hypothetical protein
MLSTFSKQPANGSSTVTLPWRHTIEAVFAWHFYYNAHVRSVSCQALTIVQQQTVHRVNASQHTPREMQKNNTLSHRPYTHDPQVQRPCPARARHQRPLSAPALAPAALLLSCIAHGNIASRCNTDSAAKTPLSRSRYNLPVQPVQKRQAQGPPAQPQGIRTRPQPAGNAAQPDRSQPRHAYRVSTGLPTAAARKQVRAAPQCWHRAGACQRRAPTTRPASVGHRGRAAAAVAAERRRGAAAPLRLVQHGGDVLALVAVRRAHHRRADAARVALAVQVVQDDVLPRAPVHCSGTAGLCHSRVCALRTGCIRHMKKQRWAAQRTVFATNASRLG